MEEQDQEVALRNNQQADYDYVDRLQPGYRFCPTDVEIIVHYLIPQIKTGTHPPCRLHKVNIYDHTPEELAEEYCPCDANWYFLTPRTRRYPKGKRPSRIVKEGVGHWHASQKNVPVYRDDPAVKKQVVVGKKTSFTYQKGRNDDKTPWLMHEYTTNDPDLPHGSGQDGSKLTQWVICKIYMKPSEHKKQIRGRVLNAAKNQDQAGGYDDQEVQQMNQQQQPLLVDDHQPSPKRQRLSSQGDTSDDQQNELIDHQHHPHHEEATNNNLSLTTNEQQLDLFQQWFMSATTVDDQAPFDDHVVQEYFHQDPTSILHAITVDDQAPYQQENVNETMSICPQPQIIGHVVCETPTLHQEYFHQDPTSILHTTTVDDQAPYHHDQQQNINQTMSICPQPQITSHVCESPLPEFTSDQVQHSTNGDMSTVYHHGLQSMSNNIAQYSSDFYLTAPPTPQPTDDFPHATTTTTDHHDNATSPLTPPTSPPQPPLAARDYYTELMTMDPNSPSAPKFKVTDYWKDWVRNNLLSHRYPPTTIEYY